MTTSRPYELLARFAADGKIAGVSVRSITTLNGRDYESDPQPLSGASDPAFAAFATQFAAGAVAERDSLQSALTALTAERDSLQTQVDTIPGLTAQIVELTAEKAALQAEVARLTALVPPPVPDAFLSADWPRFRNLILSDEAVQRVAVGNPTAWPLMVLYLTQLSSTPSRGADIAALWTMLEQNTPITGEEVARINAIAENCGVPLRMNEDGSIG
jgi:hypothetical protein